MSENETKYELIEKLEKIALKLDRAYKAGLVNKYLSPKVSKMLEEADSTVAKIKLTSGTKPLIASEVEALSYEAQHPYSEYNTTRSLLQEIVNSKGSLDFYTDTARDLAKRKMIQTPAQMRKGNATEQIILWAVGIVIVVAIAVSLSQNH